MSRTTSLVTSYLQTLIFGALAIRCISAWLREKDRRSGHLAWAAGLFGISTLMSAITTTFINQQAGEVAPRWEGTVSSIVLYLAVYSFLLFLSDFIPYPRWIHGLLIAVTTTGIVFSVIEKPALKINFISKTNCPFQNIPGVHNPVEYKTYIVAVLAYIGVAFGILAIAFLIYGTRSAGLARFRMLSIGSGFLLLCGLIGLLPLVIFGNPCAGAPKAILNVVTYVALVTAPLLLVGFAPPKFIRNMFHETGMPTGAMS